MKQVASYRRCSYSTSYHLCRVFKNFLHKLAENVSVEHVTSTKNFRSHSWITKAISVASYEGKLRPTHKTRGRSASPNHKIPILFSHKTDKEQLTREKSWVNDLYNDLAVKIHWFIRQRISKARIVIFCYYNASVRNIQMKQPDVKVYSINKY